MAYLSLVKILSQLFQLPIAQNALIGKRQDTKELVLKVYLPTLRKSILELEDFSLSLIKRQNCSITLEPFISMLIRFTRRNSSRFSLMRTKNTKMNLKRLTICHGSFFRSGLKNAQKRYMEPHLCAIAMWPLHWKWTLHRINTEI